MIDRIWKLIWSSLEEGIIDNFEIRYIPEFKIYKLHVEKDNLCLNHAVLKTEMDGMDTFFIINDIISKIDNEYRTRKVRTSEYSTPTNEDLGILGE